MKKSLDAFHRKQLRQVLGIRYPHKVSNKKLYGMCNEMPISILILQLRWQLFGHILRRSREIPANKAIEFYFSKTASKKFSGKKRTTLPITLHNDLQLLYFNSDESNEEKLKLQSIEDYEYIRSLASDRRKFKSLVSTLVEAAKVNSEF